jgi:hypothetical protein
MGGDIAQEKDGASAGFLVTNWAVGKSGILLRACAPRHTSTALRWHTLQSQQSLNLLGFLSCSAFWYQSLLGLSMH